MQEGERRLAAIMFTDIVGYAALIQADESSTLQALEKHRSLLRPMLASHGGKEIKTIGDAFLVEFPSALDAVLCAVAAQQMMRDRRIARGESISLRIGIHLGDVVERGNDILGDAVNIASRIQSLAAPDGICITEQVYDQVANKLDLALINLGERDLKNVSSSVVIYAVQMPWEMVRASKEVTELPRERIAVLPFVSFSPDPNDAYFADGMTDEIISTASGISGLSVISRTSVTGYKGTTKKVGEIGRELRVGTVLEGSFRKADGRIRVTTQLIDTATDRHLWAQNYDRDLEDVFEVQSDIARRIADALRVSILSPELAQLEKRPTRSTRAYSLYLRGRFLWNKRGLEDMKEAIGLFDQSVKEDPGFALGYAGKADCYLLLRNNFMIDAEHNLRLASEMAGMALRLDPDLAEALTTKGMILVSDFNYQEAELQFKRAIKLKPSYATAHQWYFWMLRAVYRWKEARDEIEKAFALDPMSPTIVCNYSECLDALGETEEALRQYELASQLGVTNIFSLTYQSRLYIRLGRLDDAAETLEKASGIDADDVQVLDWRGHLEYLKGNYAQAKVLWEVGVEEAKKMSSQILEGFLADLVLLYWTTGEMEKALSCVEEIKGLPEDSKGALAFKRGVLSFAYAAMDDVEGFFSTSSQLVDAHQAEGGYFLRALPSLMPRSNKVFEDQRWGALLKRVGLD